MQRHSRILSIGDAQFDLFIGLRDDQVIAQGIREGMPVQQEIVFMRFGHVVFAVHFFLDQTRIVGFPG